MIGKYVLVLSLDPLKGYLVAGNWATDAKRSLRALGN
jgi:hypothetical protein